ncbi:MAG: terminase large subunit domain-containing protein [Christensenellales bacterium]|jgi:hypothetical protein
MGEVIWSPQPRQETFMGRGEDEALYGGAAGGGKSDALLMEALRQAEKPRYRALILRKTYKELSELIDRSRELYPRAFPGAKYNVMSHRWTFLSGATIEFGGMQHAKDRIRYQGRSYAYIAFDELTHFTFEEYDYMRSRNRTRSREVECYIRASANPGGVGHSWVKDMFVSPAPAEETIWERVEYRDNRGRERISWVSRAFIPATVWDNPKLLEANPRYIERLAAMGEAEKRALLYGDWDAFSGQVFREWRDDPAHYKDGLYSHVIDPIPVPGHWKVWRSFDWGYARPFSVGWYTIDPGGCIYRIAEYYGCRKDRPNTGLEMDPAEVAAEIRAMETQHPLLEGRKILGVADPSIWDSQTGQSTAGLMAAAPNFIYFEPGDNARIAGKMQLHYRLKFDQKGRSLFKVFSTCTECIRTLPALVYSQRAVEDVDTDGEDHIYDELRYAIQTHPVTAEQLRQKPGYRYIFDPLELTPGRKKIYGR